MSAPSISPINVRMVPNIKPRELMLIAVTKKLGTNPIAPIPKFKMSSKMNSSAMQSNGISCIDSFTGFKPPIVRKKAVPFFSTLFLYFSLSSVGGMYDYIYNLKILHGQIDQL